MHADIEQLMASYTSDATVLIATADCQTNAHKPGTGSSLCDKEKTAYLPHIMYGNPANLTEYTGNRDFATMKAFVEKHKGGAPGQPHPNRVAPPSCPLKDLKGIPDIIEKLACEFATKPEMEDKAVGDICRKIVSTNGWEEKFCEKELDAVWDKVVAHCPKGNEAVQAVVVTERDIPGMIEKFICKYATEKDIEDKAVDEICGKVCTGKLAVFTPVCEKFLAKDWDQVMKSCPKPAVVV